MKKKELKKLIIVKKDKSHGWDKDHWEYHCSDGKHPSFWNTIVTSPQWKAWENSNPMFDVDECRECGWFSQHHFQEFIKFVVSTHTEGK